MKLNSDKIDAQTVMSDSCNKLYNTLSNLNLSHDSYGGNNGTPQQSIGFTISAAATTIDE